MSRVSQKSGLSPSIAKGSDGAIDLGKNSGVDMGRKSQPSVTSGGIGITQEVTNVGGMSVSAGANIDITPLDFGISINPSEGTVSIASGAEIPGGLLGISGGLEVDLNTGEIIGGSIGGEALGLGINISNSKEGGLGVEFTVQIPGTPIELSLGLGFPSQRKPPIPSTETPTPSSPPPGPFPPPTLPLTGGNKRCTVIVARIDRVWVDWGGNSGLEYSFEETTGSVSKDERGYLKIVSSFTYKSRSRSGEVQNYASPPREFSPSWQQSRFYDYFGGNATIGASGLESEIYKLMNNYHGYVETKELYFTRYHAYTYTVIYSDCPLSSTISPSPNSSPVFPSSSFPNPPPRKEKRMDTCCRETLAFLRAIYTGLGLAKFPGKLPATIIQEIPKEGEQPAEPPQEPIADLVDLFMWQFRRDDERWGQWEIEINIKDADLTKEGNQGKSVKFPNLAESVAEMEGQMLSIQTNVEALVALSIRNLSEAGMARQEAIKGYLASMAIAKYMAFPYKEFDVEIPSTYTPGATSVDKLIVESIIHTKGIDYEDKETQRDLLLDLLQAAAITRAVHWRQVDPKNDIKKQILSQLKGSVDLSERITNVKAVAADGDTPQKKESWEDKLDAIENGFGFSTGIEDANTPYGRDRERRPRIRQIGDNIAQAGKNE